MSVVDPSIVPADRPGSRRTEVLSASPPMFASPLLDRMSRVHPVVPPLLFLPAIAALAIGALHRLPVPTVVGLAAAGYLVWTLTEYWLHRVVFHLEPEGAIGARLHWMMHGVHHDHPNDRLRLVMPPSMSVPLSAAFFALFHLVLGEPDSLAFAAGFFAGYLAYDMTHYYVHHARPRSRVGRRLRELHMRHHFQDDTAGFGVSAPWWDRVFGTAPASRRSQASRSR